MKLRALLVFAVVLLVGVVGAWLWFARDVTAPPMGETSQSTSGPASPSTTLPPVAPPPADSAPGLVGPAASPSPAATPADAPPAPPVRITSSVQPGLPIVRGGSAPTPLPAVALALAARNSASRVLPQAEGRADLENVRTMFRDFRTRLGENPVGSNAEIMKAIMGGNPANARLGPPEGQSLNEKGELVDRWGTPYFFHQLSKDKMEIRSGGPDHTMWTSDDLVSQ